MTGLDFAPRMLERARRKLPPRPGWRATARAPFGDASFEASTVGFAFATSPTWTAASASSGGCSCPAAASPCSRSPSRADCSRPSTGSGSTRSCRCSERSRRRRRVLVPPGERQALPRARRACGADARRRLRGRRLPHVRRRDRFLAHWESGMTSALATIRDTPGLDLYLEELEERLQETVHSHGGTVSAVSTPRRLRSNSSTFSIAG